MLLIWRTTSCIHMSEASVVSSPRCFLPSLQLDPATHPALPLCVSAEVPNLWMDHYDQTVNLKYIENYKTWMKKWLWDLCLAFGLLVGIKHGTINRYIVRCAASRCFRNILARPVSWPRLDSNHSAAIPHFIKHRLVSGATQLLLIGYPCASNSFRGFRPPPVMQLLRYS